MANRVLLNKSALMAALRKLINGDEVPWDADGLFKIAGILYYEDRWVQTVGNDGKEIGNPRRCGVLTEYGDALLQAVSLWDSIPDADEEMIRDGFVMGSAGDWYTPDAALSFGLQIVAAALEAKRSNKETGKDDQS